MQKAARLTNMGRPMLDDDIMRHIICNLPDVYDIVVEMFQKELSKGEITIEELRKILCTKHKRMSKGSNKGTSLSSTENYKSEIEYKHCGKRGHKSDECFKLPKNVDKFIEFYNKKCSK